MAVNGWNETLENRGVRAGQEELVVQRDVALLAERVSGLGREKLVAAAGTGLGAVALAEGVLASHLVLERLGDGHVGEGELGHLRGHQLVPCSGISMTRFGLRRHLGVNCKERAQRRKQ